MTTRDVDRIRFVTEHFNDLQGLRAMVPIGLVVMCQGAISLFGTWPWMVLLVGITMLGAFVLMFRSGRYYRRTFGEVEQRQAGLGLEGPSLSIYSPAGAAPLLVGRPLVNPALRIVAWAAIAVTLGFLLRAAIPSSAILITDHSGVDPWVQLHQPLVVITDRPETPRSLQDLKPLLGQSLYAIVGTIFLGVWFLWRRRRSQIYYLAIGASLLGLAVLGFFLGVILPELMKLNMASLLRFFLPPLAHVWMAQVLCGASMVIAGLLDHWQIARVLRPVGREA